MANENEDNDTAGKTAFSFTYDKVKVTVSGPAGFSVADASAACEKVLGKIENGDADVKKTRAAKKKAE